MEEIINLKTSPESKALLDFTEHRIKTQLGCIQIFTGEVGKGKSYAGLRFLELWYKRWFDEEFKINNVCETLEQAILLVKDFKRKGEGIMIEELSVLAGSRDSLTLQNKLWNKFVDTCRIKQVVIIGNCPHISFIDKHFQMMCQVWVDCLGVNFRKKIVVAKPFWLQTSPHKNEPYKHKFIDDDGYGIDICYFRKPSKKLTKDYDKLKINSVNKLYQELAQRIIANKEKKDKELKKNALSPRERQIVALNQKGLSAKEIQKELGFPEVNVIYRYLTRAEKKGAEVALN